MCGIFSLTTEFKKLGKHFDVAVPDLIIEPSDQIRPSYTVAAIFMDSPDIIGTAVWGIHAWWDKLKKTFLINTRSESLNNKTWHDMFASQRCVVLMDGFMEGMKMPGTNKKLQHYFKMKNGDPFAVAAIWQDEVDSDGIIRRHLTLITTVPNEIVAKVHERMIGILTPEEVKVYLNPDTTFEEAAKLITPYPSENMMSFQL